MKRWYKSKDDSGVALSASTKAAVDLLNRQLFTVEIGGSLEYKHNLLANFFFDYIIKKTVENWRKVATLLFHMDVSFSTAVIQ